MKKIILSLVLLVSIVGAQTASAFSFDWGVTGGYNLTKLKIDKQSKFFDTNGNSGWFLGVKANVGLIGGFGLDGALPQQRRQAQSWRQQQLIFLLLGEVK